jgi:hypothetical protein
MVRWNSGQTEHIRLLSKVGGVTSVIVPLEPIWVRRPKPIPMKRLGMDAPEK